MFSRSRLIAVLAKKMPTWLTARGKKSRKAAHPMTQYDQLGGAPAVRQLANRFYDIMETDHSVKALLAMHPQPLDSIRERFYEFLSGWLGGPPLFEQKYGHPRLRARHLPFSIDQNMRDQWLHCMYQALDEQVNDVLLKQQLKAQFTRLAHHMLNC